MSVATKAQPRRTKKLTRTHKPPEMSTGDWQIGLRRQFAAEQTFLVENLGRNPVFSEFSVENPQTRQTYRVVIRGERPGGNYCSCPDYAVNTLGTCKHIEFVLQRLRSKHAAALAAGHTPPFGEVYVRYGARREVVWSPGAECPTSLRRLAGRYFDGDGRLRPDAYGRIEEFLRAAAKTGHEVKLYEDALRMIADARDARTREELLRRRFGVAKGRAWNQLVKAPLHPYQREGALFAARAGRAIIADEMGLGKTIQAIAAAEILARECGVERVLIVCPASLKYQWKHEIAKFSERPALVIEGLSDQRREAYGRGGAFFKIVNYDVVHRDLEPIAGWAPELVILDEAQRIKNWQTRAAKAVKRIVSRFAIVLTGTPLENRIDELHSIVEFVDRHRLGPLFAFKEAHELREGDSPRVIGYRHLDRVTKTLAPILIRRTKKQVLNQLPPRMDKNFFVPMTPQQWKPHNENRDTVAMLVAKWRRFHYLSEEDQLRLRIALQYMRMACDSTYLVDHRTKFGTKVEELERVLEDVFELPDQKVVIFSQWVRMNELVAEMLDDRKWGHVHLHGGVPSRQRAELTRALREEPDCRVFLSTDAGGVGLNLQTASTVINMDLPWNPAVLEQRIGRVHRMGQQRPVRVVNFVSEGTIEHGMLSLLSFKRSVFAGIIDGETSEVFMKEGAMARFIKTVETATAAAPAVAPRSEGEAAEGRIVDPPGRLDAAGSDRTEPESATGDIRALGDLLNQGAQMLMALGRALAAPGDAAVGISPAPAGVVIDRQSGRPELRVPLPDPATLQAWMGRLAGVLHAVRGAS